MKFHMLMLMNAWMMLVLVKCKCQMQCLTLGCYIHVSLFFSIAPYFFLAYENFGERLMTNEWNFYFRWKKKHVFA